MRIDLHTHVVPPRWEDFASRYGGGKWPRLEPRDGCRATIMTGEQFFRDIDDRAWSPERRIENMDRLGIDRQALSPPPVMFCYWAEPKAARAFARMQNENVAAIAARHPRRFSSMAAVPLQDPALAIEELRHCREARRLGAVEIGTCPGGRGREVHGERAHLVQLGDAAERDLRHDEGAQALVGHHLAVEVGAHVARRQAVDLDAT